MSRKSTLEEVLNSFELKHKGKYDYSRFVYVDNRTKGIIICREHGEFLQTPNSHKNGNGCPWCAGNVLNLFVVLKKFFEKYGDFYDYSLFEYIDSHTKGIIICKEHGKFETTAKKHIDGVICSECRRCELMTPWSEVLESFKLKHGDRYGYDEFEYKNHHTKGVIICKEHGRFKQNVTVHRKGHGCPTCAGVELKTLDFVLSAFREKYGDKYDYSKFIYINSRTKGIIICKEHGEFRQSYSTHLRGGCRGCVGRAIPTTEEAIAQFIEKHGDLCDYSKFVYVTAKTKSIIICKKHGEFLQTPDGHKRGLGCPNCKISRGERIISNILKSLSVYFETQKKFDGCVGVKFRLPFDFYLPLFNLIIEYDGIQHFKPVKRFGGDVGLVNTQKTDNIKNDFCSKNGINLLRIPYTEIKNLKTIISDTINKNIELSNLSHKDYKNEN